jgi:hypothetical protein
MSAPVFRAYSGAAVVNPAHNQRAKLVVLSASPCTLSPGCRYPTTANTGFGGRAYWQVGGFRPPPSREDVEPVEGLEAERDTIGHDTVGRDTESSVITSARTRARAPQGFARYLWQLGGSVAGDCA